MNDRQDDRVSEGPAIGVEPELVLSDIRLRANFYVTGSMSREISAAVTTSTPTRIDSLDRTLPELSGYLRIFDSRPDRTYPGLYPGHFESMTLGEARGAIGLPSPEWYVVHLYLPQEQFAALLPLLVPAPASARLRIEIERTLDQGLFDNEQHFWNDRLSPVILFNEFEINVPAAVDR